MKKKNKAAVLFAALSILLPTAVGMGAVPAVSAAAAEEAVLNDLPDWVPTDLEQAVSFYNDHGGTYVSDGYICVLYTEEDEHGAETNYVVHMDKEILSCVSDRVYRLTETPDSAQADSEKALGRQIRVLVYQPVKAGETTLSHWNRLIDYAPVDLKYIQNDVYSFSVDSDLTPTETDVFAWLPDCCAEAEEKLKSAGDSPVFVENGYLCVYLESNNSTPGKWKEGSHYGPLEQVGRVDCERMELAPVDGSTSYKVLVFRPTGEDGIARFSWNLQEGNTLISDVEAHYMMIDNGTVFLSKTDALIEILDADTKEPVDLETLQADENGQKLHAVLNYTELIERHTEEISERVELDSNRAVNSRIGELIGYNYSAEFEAEVVDPRYRSKVAYDIDPYENGALHVKLYLQYHPTGDVNGDGKLSVSDAVAMQRWLVNAENEQIKDWTMSDYVHDGLLDARDLSKLLQTLCQATDSLHSEMILKTDYSGSGVDGHYLGTKLCYDYFTVQNGDQFYETAPYGLTRTPGGPSYLITQEPVFTVESVSEEGVTLTYTERRTGEAMSKLLTYDSPEIYFFNTSFSISDGQNAIYTLYFLDCTK